MGGRESERRERETRTHTNILRACCQMCVACMGRPAALTRERVSHGTPANHDHPRKAYLSSPRKAGELIPQTQDKKGGPSQRTGLFEI